MSETSVDRITADHVDLERIPAYRIISDDAIAGDKFPARGQMVHQGEREVTKIVWNRAYEVHECTACGMILHYDFGFEHCPYCGRKVVAEDDRRY